MKKLLALLTLCTSTAFGATLVPVPLLNPVGSTAGQSIISTGGSSAPGFAAVGLTNGVTGILPMANGGFGVGTLTGLALGNGTSAVSAYAGTSCTNQFPRSLNASGVATCATVGSADLAASLSLTTPLLNVATATSINKVGFTAPTTAATFAFPTDNAIITFQGTDTYVGRITTDTLTNKSISGATNTLSAIGNASLTNSSVTVGSTPVALGATASTIAGLTLTSPVMTAPALGTPASGVATNLTGTAASLTAGNVTTNANLTGPITSTGNATAVGAQTGTGTTFVMSASPTISGTLTTSAAINAVTTTSVGSDGAFISLSTGGTVQRSASLISMTPGGLPGVDYSGLRITTNNGGTNTVEAMRIVPAGRVLFGTTTDDGSNLVQIAGSTKVTGAFATTGATTVSGLLTAQAGASVTGTLNTSTSVQNNGTLLYSATAPTISSGFGTSPSVASNNGTATFRVNVGTGGTATGGVVGLPSAGVANGWNCQVSEFAPNATALLSVTEVSASTNASVTVTNELLSTGAATAWQASQVLIFNCAAY